MMKNKKMLVMCVVAAIAVVAVLVLTLTRYNKPAGELDEIAVARSQADEGSIHYLDDEAIALAGEGQSGQLLAEARATLDLVNAQRASAGLPGLTWNENLEQTAMVRAKECELNFSHQRPDGSDWWTVNSEIMFGENLAYLFSTAPTVVQAWMDSPTHRENIMGDYTTMGVAAHLASNGNWYWAQEFGY